MNENAEKNKTPAAKWIKRFGVAGFLFFFIKGLLWLAVIFGASYFGFEFFD